MFGGIYGGEGDAIKSGQTGYLCNGNPFGVGVLGNRGLYRTMGETGCTFFRGQGKITNLY